MLPNWTTKIVALICALQAFEALAQAPYSAGTYTFWNRGSARRLALGGATVSERVDTAAYLANHAAMVNQPFALDGSVAYGEPIDKSVSLENADLVTHRYLLFGASVLFFNRFALGVGAEQLRFIARSKSQSIHEFSDSVLEMDFSGALKVTNDLSFSGAFIRTVSRRDTTLQQDVDSGTERPSIYENGNAAKFGLLWRASRFFRIGVTHRTRSFMKAEETTGTLFSSSYIPQKTEFGAAVSLVPEADKVKPGFLQIVKLLLQVDLLSFPALSETLYYAPAVAYGEQDKFKLSTKSVWVPRMGFEIGFLQYKYFDLTGLFGAYQEPAFTVSSKARNHFTLGSHIRLWFLSTNLALDYSDNYLNKNIEITLARGRF